MGTDKALLAIDGIPLLQRIHQVASACADQVQVVGPVRLAMSEYQYIPENQPYQGPLLAFHQSLQQVSVSADWILLLACDLPYLEVSTIRRWQQELKAVPESSIAYLASFSAAPQTYEPLCGFYRDRCLPSLDKFIAEGGRSFQGWLATVEVTTIPNPEPQMFTNWNSRSDLQNSGLPDLLD
jgi:molybdenum cofactor guanylyltransferase